ncbi:hypothetical protein DFAR_2360010 [Desulfarculales bacterium]
MLKAADGGRLTEKQQQALTELETGGLDTAIAWWLKEMLRWTGLERPSLYRPLSGASPFSLAMP